MGLLIREKSKMKYYCFPKISFGIIVLNGEPFIKYCLRQIYDHAYQIIIVEGGSKKAVDIAPEGHSTDGTLESLYNFKKREDPENKLKIITRDGFWKDKDEQSQEYAKRATGDYLWQVDIDEFYKEKDIKKVKDLLVKNPDIDTVSFRQITFWGWFDYWCDSIYLRANNANEFHRLFKWEPGNCYFTHRPPTVIDSNKINLRKKKWLTANDTEKKGIFLYHYSLIFPKQVKDKCSYYSTQGEVFKEKANKWVEQCYLKINKPFRVHNVYTYPSWLMRYEGSHPEQIEQMRSDILIGRLKVDTREITDIERLLSSRIYSIKRYLLILLDKLKVFKMLIFIKKLVFNNVFYIYIKKFMKKLL